MRARDLFIDEAWLTVHAGRGGDGCVAFRREKFVPRGGPAGGDGGRGGDVVVVADRNLATLRDWRVQREVRAGAGGHGGGARKTGARGEDAQVRLPVGTLVHDADAPADAPPLVDLTEPGQRVRVARGGRGGLGNARFTLPTRQTPDFATPGRAGESRRLHLALKLIADAGLIGLPNAGKSTLLRRISAARPRVAAYPFTTRTPSLGVCEIDTRRIVVADIPGLLEGAHLGVGLGDRFLRHVERTRVLVHLLDGAALLDPTRDLAREYDTIRAELAAYDPALAARREIVVLNKLDLAPEPARVQALEEALAARGRRLARISGATGAGIEALLRMLCRALDEVAAQDEEAAGPGEGPAAEPAGGARKAVDSARTRDRASGSRESPGSPRPSAPPDAASPGQTPADREGGAEPQPEGAGR